jgi:hypothetical protein
MEIDFIKKKMKYTKMVELEMEVETYKEHLNHMRVVIKDLRAKLEYQASNQQRPVTVESPMRTSDLLSPGSSRRMNRVSSAKDRMYGT